MELIDLHTHTFFSDGILSPAELVYRCKVNDLKAVALTDHVDYSNIEQVINGALKACSELTERYDIEVVAGVELTYIPPSDIGRMTEKARKLGAEIVIVHGETTAENVPAGTNISAIRACCDILAHPGFLEPLHAKEAAERDVFIELTTRPGHRDGNLQVSTEAIKNNCRLILNTDSHSPQDVLDIQKVCAVLDQCGLEKDYYSKMLKNSELLIERIKSR